MNRERAVEIFEQIAWLMELDGENPFKIRAYQSAAQIIDAHPADIMALAAAGDLNGIGGLGAASRDKLCELAQTGHMEFFEQLKAKFPPGLLDLFSIPGLGPRKVAQLHRELGLGSIADLQAACSDGRLAALSGFGAKSVAKLQEAIAWQLTQRSLFRQDAAEVLAQTLLEPLRAHPACGQLGVVGELRRGNEVIRRLELLCSSSKAELLLGDLAASRPQSRLEPAARWQSLCWQDDSGLPCVLHVCAPADHAHAQAWLSGSPTHLQAMQTRASEQGLIWSEQGLHQGNTGSALELQTEEQLFAQLGLQFIPPELRECGREVAAAATGQLPRLIELGHLRGTFHNHTTASDGRASLREMAMAAMELGLQYLGIADHSRSSVQANGLSAERLLDQIAQIRALNAEFAGQIHLFAGSEVDIHKDGSLDFPDEVLAQLDYVVASVHQSFTLPAAEMTARLERAMRHPMVTMIGHLSGRLLARRAPYKFDLQRLLEVAAETQTIIELNASPWRLDMDWRHWPQARELGVICSINPDAHSTRGLQDLLFGVRAARKGWLRREDILNTLPLEQVREALGHKRRTHGLG